MGEQPALARDAAAIARQCPVRSDDAMAGDDDADGIVAIRVAHRTDGGGPPDPLRQRPIGDGLSAGDLAQRPPDAFLEGRAPRRHGQGIDRVELAGEIGPECCAESGGILGAPQGEAIGAVLQAQRALHPVVLIGPFHRAQPPGVIGDDGQLPQRRLETVDRKSKRLAHPARISSLSSLRQHRILYHVSARVASSW